MTGAGVVGFRPRFLEVAMTTGGGVRERSFAFAKRVVRVYRYLISEKREHILSRQLLRSGTSIGANIVEAQCGISRRDFLSKMYIAYKESAETAYWLRLLYETGYLPDDAYRSIATDCDEIRRMLASITKTTRENATPHS